MRKFLFVIALIGIGYGIYQWGKVQLQEKIQTELSRQLNRRVYIEEISLRFPLDLHLEGVRIFERETVSVGQPRFLEIDRLVVRPNLLSLLLARKIGVDRIWMNKAKLYLVRNPDGTLNVSDMLVVPGGRQAASKKTTPVVIQSVQVEDGEMILLDNALAEQEGWQTVFGHLRVNIRQIEWPLQTTTVTHFSISSSIAPAEKMESSSRIMMKGWINWLRRDLQAHLEVEDLNLTQFRPYLEENSTFFSDLESCQFQFSSEVKAVENVLTAQCQLRMSELMIKPDPTLEGMLFGVPSSTVWQWIEQSGKGASLEVVAKGHLQPFKLSSVQFSTDFMKNALASSVSFKLQQVAQQSKE